MHSRKKCPHYLRFPNLYTTCIMLHYLRFLIWTVHRTHMRRVVAALERNRFYRHNSALLRTSHPATCRGCLLLLCWPCCSCWRRPPLASRQLELLQFLRRSGPSASATQARRSEVQKDMLAGAKGMSMHTSGFARLARAPAFASLCTVLARTGRQRLAEDHVGDEAANLLCSKLVRLKMTPAHAARPGQDKLWPATQESWKLSAAPFDSRS